ncbi:MAG: hypothetical protein WCI87_04085 [Euryarchaeota archaeon]
MPRKKTLPLLFISALLLSCTTGCLTPKLAETWDPYTSSRESGEYRGYKVTLETRKHENSGNVEEIVTAEGGSCWKTKNADGLITWTQWKYPDGTVETKNFDSPIEDPIPGLLAGIRLVNLAHPTSSSTEEPLTPFTSGIGDNTQAIDTTPEQSTAVPTAYPTGVPGGPVPLYYNSIDPGI